jgi:hypothetical protein
MTDDIKTIREALECGRQLAKYACCIKDMDDALAALDRIEAQGEPQSIETAIEQTEDEDGITLSPRTVRSMMGEPQEGARCRHCDGTGIVHHGPWESHDDPRCTGEWVCDKCGGSGKLATPPAATQDAPLCLSIQQGDRLLVQPLGSTVKQSLTVPAAQDARELAEEIASELANNAWLHDCTEDIVALIDAALKAERSRAIEECEAREAKAVTYLTEAVRSAKKQKGYISAQNLMGLVQSAIDALR